MSRQQSEQTKSAQRAITRQMESLMTKTTEITENPNINLTNLSADVRSIKDILEELDGSSVISSSFKKKPLTLSLKKELDRLMSIESRIKMQTANNEADGGSNAFQATQVHASSNQEASKVATVAAVSEKRAPIVQAMGGRLTATAGKSPSESLLSELSAVVHEIKSVRLPLLYLLLYVQFNANRNVTNTRYADLSLIRTMIAADNSLELTSRTLPQDTPGGQDQQHTTVSSIHYPFFIADQSYQPVQQELQHMINHLTGGTDIVLATREVHTTLNKFMRCLQARSTGEDPASVEFTSREKQIILDTLSNLQIDPGLRDQFIITVGKNPSIQQKASGSILQINPGDVQTLETLAVLGPLSQELNPVVSEGASITEEDVAVDPELTKLITEMNAYTVPGGSKERFFGRTSSQKEGVIVKICSILKDEKQDLAQKIEGIDKLITTSELGKHRNYFQGDKLTKSLEMANRALEILKLQVKEQASNTSTPTP